MQTADFNIKEALKKIIKSNDKTQWIGSIASVIILFIWYIVYYVYMPDQRLVLFVIHCFATLLPLMLILNRKKLGLDSAHCRLIALSSIATLNGYMINICPSEIYAVVFLATCSIFLGSGLLAFW